MTDAAVTPLPDRTADAIVGGNVKYLLDDRGTDRIDLCRVLNVDTSTLSLKLGGKRKWTITELVKVSDFFGVSIDALARKREFDPAPRGGSSGQLHGVGTTIKRMIGSKRQPSD